MNDHDRENLSFMLNADPATLSAWYESLSPDDLIYAMELLVQARSELEMRSVEIFDDVGDLTEANIVLDRYRLQQYNIVIMKYGIIFQSGAWWLGAHYSEINKRMCINIIPCFTIWIAASNGAVPHRKSILSRT